MRTICTKGEVKTGVEKIALLPKGRDNGFRLLTKVNKLHNQRVQQMVNLLHYFVVLGNS